MLATHLRRNNCLPVDPNSTLKICCNAAAPVCWRRQAAQSVAALECIAPLLRQVRQTARPEPCPRMHPGQKRQQRGGGEKGRKTGVTFTRRQGSRAPVAGDPGASVHEGAPAFAGGASRVLRPSYDSRLPLTGTTRLLFANTGEHHPAWYETGVAGITNPVLLLIRCVGSHWTVDADLTRNNAPSGSSLGAALGCLMFTSMLAALRRFVQRSSSKLQLQVRTDPSVISPGDLFVFKLLTSRR